MGKHRQLANEVRATISAFEHLVISDTPADLQTLSKARVVLVQCVNAYVAYLGSLVVPVDKVNRIRPWKEAHSKVVALRAIYSEHIVNYSASAI